MSNETLNDLFIRFQMKAKENYDKSKKETKLGYHFYRFTETCEEKVRKCILENIIALSDFGSLIESIKEDIKPDKDALKELDNG